MGEVANQLIPPFLEEFKSEIEKYRIETVRITATPVSENGNLQSKQSKFLGKPYLPVGVKYPRSNDGTPMIMLAQLNFEEIPLLENYPTQGILQFFVPAKDWYDMNEYCVLFHENAGENVQTDFSFLTKELYEESPVSCEHTLSFTKETEYGSTEDSRFKLKFNGKS